MFIFEGEYLIISEDLFFGTFLDFFVSVWTGHSLWKDTMHDDGRYHIKLALFFMSTPMSRIDISVKR